MSRQVTITDKDERIIEVLEEYREPMTPTEIGQHLKPKITEIGRRGQSILKKERRRSFYNSLEKLERLKIIVKQKNNRYLLIYHNLFSVELTMYVLYQKIIRGTIGLLLEHPNITPDDIFNTLNQQAPQLNIPYVVDEIIQSLHPGSPSLLDEWEFRDGFPHGFWRDLAEEWTPFDHIK